MLSGFRGVTVWCFTKGLSIEAGASETRECCALHYTNDKYLQCGKAIGVFGVHGHNS